MDSDRIAKLLLPYIGVGQEFPDGAKNLLASISIYVDMLIRWNARMNLTAIRDPENIVTRHFGESLFAARHLFPASEAPLKPAEQLVKTRLADVGSGAGFPGIPIKLWAPEISLTLIESNQKKSVFLREISRALTLTDIDIQTVRAETLPAASFDVVTLRAVEKFQTVLPAAMSLVAPGGRLALLIGAGQISQAESLLSKFNTKMPIPLPDSESRCLIVASKATGQVPS